jgi:NADP-dependent 3-hydroxy acid dehydrogenase YdfG
LIVGFGPAISSAVAERFGAEGFAVGLVARNEKRIAEGVKALEAKGVRAAGFTADASDPASIRAALAKARSVLGPLTVLHWNAAGGGPGDLLGADAAQVRATFDVSLVGLLAAVEAALPDLRAAKNGALLVTNGAFGEIDDTMEAAAVKFGAMGLAVSNAAKNKLVGLLAARLSAEGVYVGQVMVAGIVKGSASDRGSASVDASRVATKFWEMYQARQPVRVRVM